MMKIAASILLWLAFLAVPVAAQTPALVKPCVQTSPTTCPPVSSTTPFPVTPGKTGTAGDATITSGGVAQNLFGGTVPANGFSIINPNLVDDCWWSDSTTAAVNGRGSGRLAANGGEYATPSDYLPVGAVSVICPTTNDVLTARRW